MANRPGTKKKKEAAKGSRLSEILKHPLVILLISAIIIPSAVYFYKSCKSAEEKRKERTAEFRKKNAELEGQLSFLYTELSNFYKSIKGLNNADELKRRREEFNKTFGARYAEFSKNFSDKHLWIDDLYEQGIELELFSREDLDRLKATPKGQSTANLPRALIKLRDSIQKYKANFFNSTGTLGDFKRLLTDFNPDDPEIEKRIAGDFITGRFNRLDDERDAIVSDLIKTFTE